MARGGRYAWSGGPSVAVLHGHGGRAGYGSDHLYGVKRITPTGLIITESALSRKSLAILTLAAASLDAIGVLRNYTAATTRSQGYLRNVRG